NEEGLSLDIVSEGELYTALQAGFPTESIHMHGNIKSYAELELEIEHHTGCIVIDNFYEVEMIASLLEKHDQTIDVLIHLTPGIESNTHKYIMTGNEDSKFGFNLENGQAEKGIERLLNEQRMNFKGLHCHIGSQIFETEGFVIAVDTLFSAIKK